MNVLGRRSRAAISSCALAVAIAGFGVVTAPVAHAAEDVLQGTTVITGSSSAAEHVQLPMATTFTLTATQSSDVRIAGSGRVVGFVLTQGAGLSGISILAVKINECWTAGCAPARGASQFVEVSSNGIVDDGGNTGSTYTLPAGEYTLTLLADSAPVTATLTLPGVPGSVTLSPTGSPDVTVASATPTSTPENNFYAAGSGATLGENGGWTLDLLDFVTVQAMHDDGGCLMDSPPADGVYAPPDCNPGGGRTPSFIVLPFPMPGSWQFTLLDDHAVSAGTTYQGLWEATAGWVREVNNLQLWIGFSPLGG